jgi:predicted transcriptional regulator
MLIQTVKELPEDASIEDAMESLLFLAKIEKGIAQADAGKTLSHRQVRAKMRRWLK